MNTRSQDCPIIRVDAYRQLDLATKAIYEDNARLEDAIKLHTSDSATLREVRPNDCSRYRQPFTKAATQLNQELTQRLTVARLELEESKSMHNQAKSQLTVYKKRSKHQQAKVSSSTTETHAFQESLTGRAMQVEALEKELTNAVRELEVAQDDRDQAKFQSGLEAQYETMA
jgi:chromosome segregation ATPase